jgi:hypothetical protein
LSQANLATWHRLLDMDLGQQFSYLPFSRNQELSEGLHKALDKQKQAVSRYLFDDGYDECINEDTEDSGHPPEAYELKRLKIQHLARIANHARRWNLVLLPRAPESLPSRASNIPITYEPPKVTKKGAKFFHRREYQLLSATCRLISLTHKDYNGNAVAVLKENLYNNSFLPEIQVKESDGLDSPGHALEFRTHFCLARLASEALSRYETPIIDEEDIVARLNRRSFGTKEWTAAHLRLAEMQALEVLRGVSFSAAREYEELRNKSPPFRIHDAPCPAKKKISSNT